MMDQNDILMRENGNFHTCPECGSDSIVQEDQYESIGRCMNCNFYMDVGDFNGKCLCCRIFN